MTLIQKLTRFVFVLAASSLSVISADASILQVQVNGTVNSIGGGAAFWGGLVNPGTSVISTYLYDDVTQDVLSATIQIGTITFTADSGVNSMTAVDNGDLFETTLDGYFFSAHSASSAGLTDVAWDTNLYSTNLALLDPDAGPLFQTHPISAFNAVQQMTFQGTTTDPEDSITSVDIAPTTFVVSSVPEPTSIALLVAGIAMVAIRRRRRY